MIEAEQKPLVLVVDDEPDWQDMIRAMLRRLGAEVLLADTLDQACEIAAKHPPGTPSALALVIIDMRLPHKAKDLDLDEEAGIHVLHAVHALQAYHLIECPMVVFTAWPTYENCVKAVKAGAWAYIAKEKDEDGRHGGSRGFEELRELCERLLVKQEPLETAVPPDDEWFGENYDWLSQDYAGQWVALAKRDLLGEIPEGACERQGVVVIPGASYEEVRDLVIKLPALLRQTPVILPISKLDPSP